MADRGDPKVGWMLRGVKTAIAEPFAGKAGEMLGEHFLRHPQVVGILDKVNPDWRTLLATGIKAGGGIAEIPGNGPLIYVMNEALDAFFGGLGRSVENFKDATQDEIANDLFVISAVGGAVTRLNEVLASEVVVDGKWYHATGCPEVRGRKKMTLLQASQFGYLPMNCPCLGAVFNVPTEDAGTPAPKAEDPLTIIEIMSEIEENAVDANDPVLLGAITHFCAEFTELSESVRLKFELLAKEKRAKAKLGLLIGYDKSEWEAVLDAMLDDPVQAKASGIVRTVVGGAGKLGKQVVKKTVAEVGEVGRIIGSAETAIKANTADLNLRYAEQLRARALEKSFRNHQGSKRGWFAYLAYGMFFFSIVFTIYIAVTH